MTVANLETASGMTDYRIIQIEKDIEDLQNTASDHHSELYTNGRHETTLRGDVKDLRKSLDELQEQITRYGRYGLMALAVASGLPVDQVWAKVSQVIQIIGGP